MGMGMAGKERKGYRIISKDRDDIFDHLVREERMNSRIPFVLPILPISSAYSDVCW